VTLSAIISTIIVPANTSSVAKEMVARIATRMTRGLRIELQSNFKRPGR